MLTKADEGGGGVSQMLTIADGGGRGGPGTPDFSWRNMWTAPKGMPVNCRILFFLWKKCQMMMTIMAITMIMMMMDQIEEIS